MTATTLKLQSLDLSARTHSVLAAAWADIKLWRSRARERRHLALLSTELLGDVGISAEAASIEISKPFWRA